MEETEFKALCDKVESYAEKRGMISVPLVQKTFGISYSAARDVVKKLAGYKSIEFIGGVEYKLVRTSSEKVKALRKKIADRIEGLDPRLGEMAVFCAQEGDVSVTLIQRRLGLGYLRVARMRDSMLELGLCEEPTSGSKPKYMLTEAETREVFGLPAAEEENDPKATPKPADEETDGDIKDVVMPASDSGETDSDETDDGENDSDETDSGETDEADEVDDDDDDDDFASIEEILADLRYKDELDDCIKLLCAFYFINDKELFLWRLKAMDKYMRERFPFNVKFYEDLINRLETCVDYTDDNLETHCGTKLELYRKNAFLLGNDKTAERLLYEVHEGMLRLVALNFDKDTDRLVAAAQAQAETCDKNDAYGRFIAENIGAELSRFTEKRLPFLKAEIMRRGNDGFVRRTIDITYVIDGSDKGALIRYADCLMAEVAKRLARHCHSATGDFSAMLRQRFVCYGNSSADGENTITQCDFVEMPYGRAFLRELLFHDVNKKANIEKVSNGLEGLWAALCSKWTELPENGTGRHLIVVLTKNFTYAPNENPIIRDDADYPDDFEKYTSAWNGNVGAANISQDGKMLLVCAPNAESAADNWGKVTQWNLAIGLENDFEIFSPYSLAENIILMCTGGTNNN